MPAGPTLPARDPPVTPVISGTVYEAFCRSAARHPDNDFLCVLPRTAQRYGVGSLTINYSRAARQVEDLRERYWRAGFGHGHRAGLMLENRPDMFLHWFALNALGVSVVPIHPDWRTTELAYLISHSEICAAVVPAARSGDLARAAAEAGRELVITPPDLAALSPVGSPGPMAGTEPDARTECALLYTSGTTGRPKGCVLTNEYYLWAGMWYMQVGGLCQLDPGRDRLLSPLPMSHMNAMAFSTLVMVLTGGCIVPLDRFHPSSWWDDVRESHATIVHYLGVMPAMLLGSSPSESDRRHSVRFGFGAGVSPRLHVDFEQRFGFPLLEAWAMTETGAGAVLIANQAPRKPGSSCFGRPGPLLDWRIVDAAGADVPAGEPGELWVRSGTARREFGFFREYWKDPQATSEAWEGGWFHTGDIVRVDAEGDFHFVDRGKNVIRRSGENISAVEVEGVILQHPRVAGVGVTGVPDPVRGDEVMACVVPRGTVSSGGQVELAHELLNLCLQQLAYFKAPGYIAFCERLPLTATEKIQRAQLRELALALLEQPATVDLRAAKTRTSVA
ncbi:MAG TPA: AMP-binding protein [Steroidobacteraceae bacterium]|nr:AMP-binding protein [Steroidobacteraceae bacterium]